MPVLALDFDGVICDSAQECLISACFARANARGERFEPRLSAVPKPLGAAFSQMRPFVRIGMDYLVALDLIERKAPVASQDDFDNGLAARLDSICREYGVADADALETYFHDARTVLREQDVDAWMALNPLYDGMALGLNACRDRFNAIYVVTNKPTKAALAILAHHGVALPEAHVLGSDKFEAATAKNDHLHRVSAMASVPFEDIHFVDDQVAHLIAAAGLGANCYLAGWGYTSAEQIRAATEAGISVCGETELLHWMPAVLRGESAALGRGAA